MFILQVLVESLPFWRKKIKKKKHNNNSNGNMKNKYGEIQISIIVMQLWHRIILTCRILARLNFQGES